MTNNIMETNKDLFIQLCRKNIKRDGIEDLLNYISTTDFYKAPASTRFHGCYKGGLVEHSLNVYDALINLDNTLDENVKDKARYCYDKESLTIVSLLHDLCKANFYVPSTRNVKDASGKWTTVDCFTIDDKFPMGHGEKSIYLIRNYIKLTDDEALAIRWHMGGFDNSVKGGDMSLSKVFENCPLALALHIADMQATYFYEK